MQAINVIDDIITYIEHKWFKITDYQAFKILNTYIILIDNQ